MSRRSLPGQAERLKELGINVLHELKGVGENLRDHYAPRMKWTIPKSLALTYNVKGRGPRLPREGGVLDTTDRCRGVHCRGDLPEERPEEDSLFGASSRGP